MLTVTGLFYAKTSLTLMISNICRHLRKMQSYSNGLNNSVSDSVEYKQMEVKTYTLNSKTCVGSTTGSEVMLSGWCKVNKVLIVAWSVSHV